LELGRGWASVALEGDGFEARCRGLVLGLGPAAVEAEFALGAIVAASVVDGGLGWVGVGHERSSGFGGNGRGSVVGCDDAALSFFDIVGGMSGGGGGVGGFEPRFGVVASGGGTRSVGPGNLKVLAELFGGLEFHELSRLGEVDTCVIGKIAWENEQKSLSDEGVAEDGGVFASLDVLKLGGESFKAVEELGGFLDFLGTASHPSDLRILKDGLGFKFLVKGVEELLVGSFPSGPEEVLDVPVLGCYAGGGCFY